MIVIPSGARDLAFCLHSHSSRHYPCSLDCGYRIDILVEQKIVLELKCVESILPVHQAQLLTYMRLNKSRVGLVLNFHVPIMIKGIIRKVL